MKTLYALVFACLTLQACNSPAETPTGSINVVKHGTIDRVARSYEDDYAMWTTLPTAEYWIVKHNTIDRLAKSYEDDYAMWTTLPAAEYWIDTTIAGDHYTAAVAPDIQSIDDAEFDGTSRDDTGPHWTTLLGSEDTDNTGSVNPRVHNDSLDIESESYWPLP